MRLSAPLIALAALAALTLGPALHAEAENPAITDSGEVRLEDAVRLIEDESPAAGRKMPLLIQNIEATLRSRPNDPDYLVLLARATTRMEPFFGMYRGVQLADEALKARPGHVEALLYKAEQATRSTCRQCAADLIEEAAKAGAPAARLHLLKAALYMMESMGARQNPGGAAYENAAAEAWQRVVDEAQKALAVETDPLRRARLYAWMFDMYQQAGDAAKARAAAEAALAANPEGRAFIERYAGFLMYSGDIDRAAELAGKLAYFNGYPRADEIVALALYLKWAKAWEKAPATKRTEELFAVARSSYKDLPGLVHTASGSEATAPVALALIRSGKYDVRTGDYRDQDGDTTLGNVVLRLADQANARQYGTAGPQPVEDLNRLLKLLLEKGANPNAWVSRGREPMLAAAARSGYGEAVKTLVEAGARVNDHGASGTTPLIAAAQSRDRPGANEIAKLLLARGADTNAPDHYRQTPLIAAARNGNAGLVNALLAAGADPRLLDENDYGPLEYAAQAGDLDTVKRLLAADLPVRRVVNGCGTTDAARLAEQAGHKAIAELLRGQRKEGI